MILDKKNICFYCYSPSLDSGHIKRIIRLATKLKKTNNYNLFLIFNSKYNIFKKELLTIFNNILFLKKENNFKKINKFIERSKPDFFITEFFPFGRTSIEDEAIWTINKLKKTKTKIISIIPMPYFTHSEKDKIKLLNNLKKYNKVIIFTPTRDIKYFAKTIHFEKRIKTKSFINLFRQTKNKTHFVGYVIDNDIKGINEEKNSVLVTNGAGSVLTKIVDFFIKAKKYLPDIKMTIITGISTDKRKFKKWKRMIKDLKLKNIRLIKYVKTLIPYIKKNEIIISSAGSTAYEILRYSKKSILVPYEGKSGHEHSDQIARAIMLNELINSSILREKEISVSKIITEIKKKLNESKPQYYFDNQEFSGQENFCKILKSYANR